MSLLLDALKKAEKAKEEAQRRAEADETAAPSAPSTPPDLRLSEEARASGTPHVRTRDELPDISQSLEIATEDLSPVSRPREAPRELTLESLEASPQTASPVRQRPTTAQSDAARGQSAERAAAKMVFEAKMREPNPRLPFFIALGVLGAVALGTVVYFWYQLRPPPSLVNANPVPTQVEQLPSVAGSGGTAAPMAPSSGAGITGGEVPGLPGLPAAPPAPPPQQAAQAPSEPPAQARTSAARPEQRVATRAAVGLRAAPQSPAPRVELKRPSSDDALTVARPAPRLDPDVAAGYAAYQEGDLAAARTHYEQALQKDAGNRDALLGLAALDMRAQRYDAAATHYRRLLQANPRDPYALAGLLALRGGQVDPLFAESRVKTLLASDTGTDVLNFTLGNEYARQGRWGEAQQAYFKAFAADPSNPDFAYNLAVSLEHIGKPELALEQYRQALALAQQRAASFDPAAVRKRVEELSN
ncbi:MAG TPA: tetratricopeptide repeat protein [Burkholderiales bacterium]|nr:tetratricopeptide repeat protein [Burkholderiales bacterium]